MSPSTSNLEQRFQKVLKIALIAFCVAVVLALIASVWVLRVYPRQKSSTHEQAIVVEMDGSTRVEDLALELEQEGILQHPRWWVIYMRWIGADEKLRSGKVRFPPDLTPADVARYAAEGYGPIRVMVTIPEGFNRYDIAARLEARGLFPADLFIKATEDAWLLRKHRLPADNAEGYLFPDTYEFWDTMRPTSVVDRMLENWRRRVTKVLETRQGALENLKKELKWTLHEIVSLASIVEEEAALPRERRRIAGVFFNRLRSTRFKPRGRLQADPTVVYGCLADRGRIPSCQNFNGKITKAMLLDASNRYNTYRHSGLPPGPVANPGVAALEAVLSPEEHNYFYFVAKGRGRHVFSETLAQHNRAVGRHILGQ